MAEITFLQVTLGAADIETAVQFYERLGWSARANISHALHEICFDIAGSRVSIMPRTAMTEAAGLLGLPDVNSICPCVTLALNMTAPRDVDSYLELAKAAGGTILKSGAADADGRYFGYFMDPDGHIFEIIYSPAAP